LLVNILFYWRWG